MANEKWLMKNVLEANAEKPLGNNPSATKMH
jgi:hypothetical protein